MRYEVDWGRPMIAEEADDPPEEPTPNPDRYLDHSMSAEERDERAELGIVPNPAWEAWIAIGRD